MTIEQFIEKAIQGGWKPEHLSRDRTLMRMKAFQAAILDPSAWKAVGKVKESEGRLDPSYASKWAKEAMHRMIDFLAEGKTLEEYISTL